MAVIEKDELKRRLEALAPRFDDKDILHLATIETKCRPAEIFLSKRFYEITRKARFWNSKEMLATIKNVAYGYDPVRSRSRGGSDGIFSLTRDFTPRNSMMKKIFDRFMDRKGNDIESVCDFLGVDAEHLKPVRVVSHHARLLGVLVPGKNADRLVLVDYDDDKG